MHGNYLEEHVLDKAKVTTKENPGEELIYIRTSENEFQERYAYQCATIQI